MDYYTRLAEIMLENGIELEGDNFLGLGHYGNGGEGYPPSKMKGYVVGHPIYTSAKCGYVKEADKEVVFIIKQGVEKGLGELQKAFKDMLVGTEYRNYEVKVVQV